MYAGLFNNYYYDGFISTQIITILNNHIFYSWTECHIADDFKYKSVYVCLEPRLEKILQKKNCAF